MRKINVLLMMLILSSVATAQIIEISEQDLTELESIINQQSELLSSQQQDLTRQSATLQEQLKIINGLQNDNSKLLILIPEQNKLLIESEKIVKNLEVKNTIFNIVAGAVILGLTAVLIFK